MVDLIEDRDSLANALKAYRHRIRKTANEVGALIGKSGKTVNAWENGRSRPKDKDVLNLMRIYGISTMEEFYGYKGDGFSFSEEEKKLIIFLRNHPDKLDAVNTLLGIDNEHD